MPRFFIGIMSGTSVDAIDTVLMDFSASDSSVVAHFSQAIRKDLKEEIHRVIANRAWPQDIEGLDRQFSQACSDAVRALLSGASVEASQVEAIGSHGQTIFHDPGGVPPVSVQIGNAGQIARATGIQTVGNFRQADIDAGGQGAPLACAYHERLFRTEAENRAIINLGGIANITLLPADPASDTTGFDTGPANTLCDAWIRGCRGLDFDRDGAWAQAGTACQGLLDVMLEDPYFSKPPPKSTGRETFNLSWVRQMCEWYAKPVAETDVQATLVELTVQSIARAVKAHAPRTSRILLCGGGSDNPCMVSRIMQAVHDVPVERTGTYGISEKWMEAMAFAWLARQTLEGKPGNIPSVTGARKEVVLGDLYQPG